MKVTLDIANPRNPLLVLEKETPQDGTVLKAIAGTLNKNNVQHGSLSICTKVIEVSLPLRLVHRKP
jgi:hypothetical protein